MVNIKDYLHEERIKSIPIVEALIANKKQSYGSLTPEFAELLGFIETYLLRGGKWHRPAVGLLSYQIAGGAAIEAARLALASLEVMHRYILAHDDIIDRDLLRHSGPTLEQEYINRFACMYPSKNDAMYSKGNAMVAGDVIHSITYEHILSTPFAPEIRIEAVRNLAKLMIETAAGWQRQTEQNYMDIEDVSEADFFKGMQLVSAQYSIVWPLRMGQIFAGRLSEDTWDKDLEIYGWHTGAAFQITDDILGMFGKPEKTGKPVGHDYREGKKTFLVLDMYAKANRKQRDLIKQTLGTDIDEEGLVKIRQLMVETGALEASQQRAARHASQALTALDRVSSYNAEAIELFRQLARLLADRTA